MNTNVTDPSATEPNYPTEAQSRRKPNIRSKRGFRYYTFWTLFALLIGYGGILVLLMVNETFLVYPGSKYPKGNWQPNFAFEEIEFYSNDSTKLVGWFLPRPESGAAVETGANDSANAIAETILLCHGNGENVAQSAAYIGDSMRQTLNADVFVFDYRGFGKSAGTPFEQGIYEDTESALDQLCKRTGKAPNEITLIGHSLGGGPAVELASRTKIKALILQRTFSSLADAAQANYPAFPVRYLMRNQYPSLTRMPRYDGPLFQSHGSADKLIPIELAKQLFEAATTSEKQFMEIEGMAHYDSLPSDYWPTLRAFFEGLASNQ